MIVKIVRKNGDTEYLDGEHIIFFPYKMVKSKDTVVYLSGTDEVYFMNERGKTIDRYIRGVEEENIVEPVIVVNNNSAKEVFKVEVSNKKHPIPSDGSKGYG